MEILGIICYLPEAIAGIMLIAIAISIQSFKLGTIICVPLFAVILLDEFVEIIVANNWLFFTILFSVVVFLKFFTYKTSNNFIVRKIFVIYIVIGIVYCFICLLKFDSLIYSFFGTMNHYFDSEKNIFTVLNENAMYCERYNEVVDNHWLYNTLICLVGKIISFAKWSSGYVFALDNSCFSVGVEAIDILKIIYTIFAYIILGAFSLLGTFLFSVVILVGVVIGVYIPYIIGFWFANFCNKLIFKYRFNKPYRSVVFKRIETFYFGDKKVFKF